MAAAEVSADAAAAVVEAAALSVAAVAAAEVSADAAAAVVEAAALSVAAVAALAAAHGVDRTIVKTSKTDTGANALKKQGSFLQCGWIFDINAIPSYQSFNFFVIIVRIMIQ